MTRCSDQVTKGAPCPASLKATARVAASIARRLGASPEQARAAAVAALQGAEEQEGARVLIYPMCRRGLRLEVREGGGLQRVYGAALPDSASA